MNVKKEFAYSVLALLASALLAFSIMKTAGDTPAQASSGDLLSVFFYDARAVLAKSLITRADSYYHGGVTMGSGVLCDHDHADDEEHVHTPVVEAQTHDEEGVHLHDTEEPTHRDHATHARDDKDVSHQKHLTDPWQWINARIHVQEHHHLQGEEIEEIIPWIWAACRASPKNTEAYGMGWYVLTKMRKQVDAGLAILEEGIRNNPDDLDLAFTLGQSLYTDVKDEAAAEAAFLLVREKARRKSKGDLSKLSEDDGHSLSSALMYLTRMAEERRDLEAIHGYYEDARVAAPTYVATRGIARTIEGWEKDEPAIDQDK